MISVFYCDTIRLSLLNDDSEGNLTMRPYSEQINQLVKDIVETVQPLKVILFGSVVRGDLTPDSDIDVLVVMPNGAHRRRTAQLLYQEISGLGVPFDVLVATPDDLERYKNNIGLIYQTVLQEGVEVYAS
jgi:predicted nucleotidyltransferase